MVDRSVRVFTIANESRFVVVRNVPALGVIEELLKRLSLYGKVCEYRLLDHADDREAALQFEHSANDESEFTDTVWVEYETVNNARHAKNRGVQKPFYGNRLQICYAPQYESRQDTVDKLAQRRQLLLRRAQPNVRYSERRPAPVPHQTPAPWNEPRPPPLPPAAADNNSEFIGPQLPSKPRPTPSQAIRIQASSEQQHSTKRRRI
ncbi:RNA-binding protein 48 [Phytophthora citrophthora]|uniref:RNA-binding protein 48 n=1 Tax=Phytophthora citrophthora TaxID=4793 RepID=A0AAD9GVG8_9STRA|nr:RNA-binding protein 48 [Phytophthora citrophthora]